MAPLVSILIPACNAAAWLADTLDSALTQTHPRIEVIIVDDGSRDETPAIARTYAAQHPCIRFVTQANAGASAARNHAGRLASGDYIQWLDADDLLSPRKIELQLALLASRPPDTLATCRWGRFAHDPSHARFVDTAVFRDFLPVEYLLGHVDSALTMHPAAWLVPAHIARRAGPWNESLSLNDDGEYFARVVLFSAGLAFTDSPEASTYYRSNLGHSLSGRRSPDAMRSLEQAGELIERHLRDYEDSPRVGQALADYWQRLCYELYPDLPAASRRAAARAVILGGSHVPPPLGPRARLLARLVGWKAAFRLRRLLSSRSA